MQDGISKVAEYQKVTGSPILDSPKVPTKDRVTAVVKSIDDKLTDLETASYQKDNVSVLSALCGLQYALNGAIMEFGMQEVFQEAFNDVHASNMSKFCNTTYEAQESIKRLQFRGIEATYKLSGGKHIILRSSDDKILNGMHFFEPKLRSILDRLKKAKAAISAETVI